MPPNDSYHRGLYRSRRGALLGVCRGLAEYFDFSVFWIRFVCVVFFLFSGLWPMAAVYLLAALVMKPEPVLPLHSHEEQAFYDGYVHARTGTVRQLQQRFERLDRRIRRLEDTVTSREFDWDRRFHL